MLTYTGEGYDYEVFLYNVYGVKSIELHVAEPGTHGTVVAVLYAAAFRDPSQVICLDLFHLYFTFWPEIICKAKLLHQRPCWRSADSF